MWDDPLKPYQIPDRWTPDHVMVRMVQAFETLSRLQVRIGPAGYGSGWPPYVHEWGDLIAQEETEAAAQARGKYQTHDVILPPDSHSVSLMEEAFLWPVRYLGGDHATDVLISTWAYRRFRSPGYEAGKSIAAVHLEAMKIAIGLTRERVVVR